MISELCQCLLIFLIFLTVIVVLYIKWMHLYWKRKKFPYVKGNTFLSSAECYSEELFNAGLSLRSFYEKAVKLNYKYVGVYLAHMPRLVVACPKLTENMLQSDFSYFTDRGFYYNEKDDPLSANLFAIGGQKWRNIRLKLSCSFTLAKLKAMFPILKKSGCDLKDVIYSKCLNNEVINIKTIAMCYNMNVIASCGFGLECNCFLDDTEFQKQGQRIFDFSSKFRLLKTWFAFVCPDLARTLGVALFGRDTTIFFTNILKDTIRFRKENNVVRHDLMNSIIELGSDFNDNEIKELAAQVFIFFAAGYETSSITLTFCLYELSINNYLQEKLRKEINRVLKKYNEQVSYEALLEMKYMDQIISETLRKYPPLMNISRVCVKDYAILDTGNVIPKGTNLDFSILGLHHNPDYYPDPNKFDPERFSNDNKDKIISSTYMPFGAGPRKCIGMQLGLVNLKLALTMLLYNYSFSLNERTKQPIEYDLYSFTLMSKHDILLNAKFIKN